MENKDDANQYNTIELRDETDIDINDITNDDLLNVKGNFFEIFLTKEFWVKVLNIILDVCFGILVFVIGTNVGYTFFYDSSEISGPSMKPTFNPLATDKYDYNNEMAVYSNSKKYERGDVIIYNHNGTYVIKRIIAVEGDRIKIDYDEESGKYCFFLNGEVLEESYVAEEYSSMAQEKVKFEALYKDDTVENKFHCRQYFDDEGYLVVPQGYIFYAGDNRTNSSDCTEYGPQPIENTIGKVIYKYPSEYKKDRIKEFLSVRVVVFFGNLFNTLKPNF